MPLRPLPSAGVATGVPTRHRTVRTHLLVLVAGALVALSACGDDDAEESFCAAGDSLRENIASLDEVDILGEGTSALEEPVEAIRSDVERLRDSGSDVASDELAGLDMALDDLGAALVELGQGVSVEDAQTLVDAAGAVASAAGDVLERLATTCE